MSVNARLIQRRWLHKLLQPVFAHDQGYQNALTYYVLTRGPASSTIERKAAPPTFPTWRNQDTATARVLNAHPLFNPASNGALCYAQIAAAGIDDPVPTRATAGDLRMLLDEMYVTLNQPEYAEVRFGECCIRMIRCYLLERIPLTDDRMSGTVPADAGLLGKDSLQSNWPSDVLPWNAYPFRYASAHELSTQARRFGYRQRDDAGRYFKNVRCSNWAMVQRDRDDSGARLHGLSTRHRPNGSRSQFLYYSGHGGPVRPLVSYDDDGNPD